MKKYYKLLSFLLCLNLLGQSVSAYEGRPSDWAVIEVEDAIDVRMVPDELQSHFQTPIKRYEYVLLALELLERNGDHIKVVEEHPFLDVDDHPYEEEIIEAYNAGIIKGYGDAQFKPDQNISRQEIASLMVNLTSRINTYKSTEVENTYEYDDQGAISGWAREYIDYCYENGIMKGTGLGASGYDIINPNGQATVEQAIIMVYRLGNNETVFEKFQLGTIGIYNLSKDEAIPEESQMINNFSQTFGEGLGFRIKVLSDNGSKVLSMTEHQGEMKPTDSSLVSLNYSNGDIQIRGTSNSIDDQKFYEDMIYLLSAYGYEEEITKEIETAVENFSLGGLYKKKIELDEETNLGIYESLDTGLTGEEKLTYWIIFEHNVFE